ncbi:MAG: YigZ family protein [Clostridia bacterium]|jgi:putative IMPACT (imprinted ancient) family translation regulator|nr:YigZ family protein [Clostridia bacterium]
MMTGEPSGTAGSPILKIVLEKGLSNVLVVVTRYFGGILLGTGGLVRAYSEATIKALEKAKIVNKKKGYQVKIITTYDQIEQFNYYANKNKLRVINMEYLENIEIMVEMVDEQLKEITNNNSKNPLKIIKYDILKEKYVDV